MRARYLFGLFLGVALLSGCTEETAAYVPSEKMAVDAYHAGDLDGALKALEEAMAAGAPPATPVRFHSRYSGMIPLPAGNEPWQIDLRQAVDLLDGGRTEDAMSLVMRVIADAPDAYEGWFVYGIAALESEEGAKLAEENFSNALAVEPDCVPCLVGRAVALESMGRPDAAEPPLTRAFALAPTEPLVKYHLARWALRDGHRDDAYRILSSGPPIRLRRLLPTRLGDLIAPIED